MLEYTLRIRDLVHGTIFFTKLEQKIIDHIFFQRLRHIRQNDVAFIVYPSLNTSRFEHALGTCRVAGVMAEHLTQSPKWEAYSREFRKQTSLNTVDEFVQLCRVYALLHDIGHLPLSHLFELSVEAYEDSKRPEIRRATFMQEWSRAPGFEKLHEAYGAALAPEIALEVVMPEKMRVALARLMLEKSIHPHDPLSVVKAIVDSEVDADRIDSIQRDGLLAGGEYGNYDIRRLCDSVFIEEDDQGWLVAYSEKALTSMEALLLDRYRVHVWIHFHHRVIAMKILVRFLIEKALERSLITKDHFNPAERETLALRDDPWLWNVLRGMDPSGDAVLEMAKRAVLYREKRNVLNLWKGRITYHELWESVKSKARVNVADYGLLEVYVNHLREKLRTTILKFEVPFKPISNRATFIYSEKERKLSGKSLIDVSRLITHLESIWEDEPQMFLLIVGENCSAEANRLTQEWIDITAECIQS